MKKTKQRKWLNEKITACLLCAVVIFTSCTPPETWGQSTIEESTSETILREVGTVGSCGSATPEEAVEGYMHYFFLQSDEAWEYAYIAEDSAYFVYDQIPDPLIEDYYYAYDKFVKKILSKCSFEIIDTESVLPLHGAEETAVVTLSYTYYDWGTVVNKAAEELGEEQPSIDEYILRLEYTAHLLNLASELIDIYEYPISVTEVEIVVVKIGGEWYVVAPIESEAGPLLCGVDKWLTE